MALSQVQVAMLVEEGLSTKQIAERFAYSTAYVARSIKLWGIENPHDRAIRLRDGAILDDIANGVPARQIASSHGMKLQSVYHLAARHGVKVCHAEQESARIDEQIRALVQAGTPTRDIARQLNLSTSAVDHRRQKLGLKSVAPHPRNNDRLDYGTHQIRYTKIAAGWTFARIAEDEGVSRQAIQIWAKRHNLRQLGSNRHTSRNRQYDYQEVASVARGALFNDQFPGIAVAGHFGVSEQSANQLIVRARRAGHDIPYLQDRRPTHWKKVA